MKILSGTVMGGRVVVQGDRLPEGQRVTILAPVGSETFEVTEAQKRELLESIAQAGRGQFVDEDALFRELDETN